MLRNKQRDWSSPRSEAKASGWLVVTERRHYNARPMCRSIMLRTLYFSSSNVVSRAFSALCVYWKFGYYPHPLGYMVPNFVSFEGPIAEVAGGEKSRTHSAYLMPREPKLVLWNNTRDS